MKGEDNYVKSSEFNNVEEVLERFEQNSRTVINERLSGIKPVCDKLMMVTATQKYKYYVALELSEMTWSMTTTRH